MVYWINNCWYLSTEIKAMKTHKEHLEIARALKAWFISQDVDPKTAGIVMVMLTADCLIEVTKKPIELQEAINLHRDLLTVEIADRLL